MTVSQRWLRQPQAVALRKGLCDSTTKLIWAVFGLVPPVMFVTGALMWWNRVIRPNRAMTCNDNAP